MSNWKVLLTYQAGLDLVEIYKYIAKTLLEPEIAKRQILRIQNGIEEILKDQSNKTFD